MQNVAIGIVDAVAPHAHLEFARGDLGIVERGLQRVAERQPRTGRVVVDRRSLGELEVEGALEEARHPLDEMADDVAGHPSLARRGLVPRRREPTALAA